MLKAYFEDVEVLSQLLEKQLRLVLSRTLNTVRKEPTIIVTALRIIEREEKADSFALQVWHTVFFSHLLPLSPGVPSVGVILLGHEADHSPPSSAEIKNVWNYTSTPPICLHDMVLN